MILFRQVEEEDPLFLDLHLLRLYIVSKLFKLSNPTTKVDSDSSNHIAQFVKQIVETKLSVIVRHLSGTLYFVALY